MSCRFLCTFLGLVAVLQGGCAFLSNQPSQRNNHQTILLAEQGGNGGGPFQGVKNFFAELDAFIDDASARRLGNGAAFYGKRKSNFYGENDKMRKSDRDTPDPTEDYQGPSGAGYFKWIPDENGRMTPVTRLKEKNIERNPNFWDKVFEKDEE